MNALFKLLPQAVDRLQASDKSAIIAALAARFAASYGVDEALVLESLEEREALGSTGFGRGVAIPHARIDGIARPVAVFLQLAAPVDFGAADDMPVDLVFGLLSPTNAGASHLHALAAISRLMRDETMRDALTESPDSEALYALLSNATERDAA